MTPGTDMDDITFIERRTAIVIACRNLREAEKNIDLGKSVRGVQDLFCEVLRDAGA
jgi:hypothetical protein